MRIRIEKAKRVLTVWQGSQRLFRCRIQLGREPLGVKHREGDGRTPEGRYYVCSKNPQSRFYRALGISYPNAEDARRAAAAGEISAEICREIEHAQRRKLRPAWDTPLGGWIMIHGQRDENSMRAGDWTAGCIAVSNEDMEWLFRSIPRGTTVRLLP